MKNKFTKSLGTVAAACAVLAMGATFVACGDAPDNKDPQPEATVSWQAIGFTDELKDSFSSFDFLGNLMSDGTGIIYRYEKPETPAVETPVTWSVETDRDGLTKLMLDDKIEDPFEAFLEEDTNTFEIQYRFAFAGSYHREVTLTISDAVKYKSVAEFKAAADERRSKLGNEEKPDDTKTAIVTFDGGAGNSIKFYADNTAVLSAFNGKMNFDYTWKLENDEITLTSKGNPSETMTSAKEGDTYKFNYSASFLGGQTLTFTCNDISALAAKTAVVTFDGGAGNSIKFYADNTAVLSAFNGKMNFDYTWKLENDEITLTSKDNPSETMTSAKEGDTYKFNYSASFLGGQTLTFTCDDISALTA